MESKRTLWRDLLITSLYLVLAGLLIWRIYSQFRSPILVAIGTVIAVYMLWKRVRNLNGYLRLDENGIHASTLATRKDIALGDIIWWQLGSEVDAAQVPLESAISSQVQSPDISRWYPFRRTGASKLFVFTKGSQTSTTISLEDYGATQKSQEIENWMRRHVKIESPGTQTTPIDAS